MNAYELADELQRFYDEFDGSFGYLEQSINMLRQQADRISELEKLLEHSIGSDCREMRYIQEIENKDARIVELEKELKRYKMAWNMAENELEAQTKPLSDADIQQISHRYHYTYNPDYVGFARAIEERHGIK